MSLTTARIHCTISLPLSGAMEDCLGPSAENALSPKVLYVRVTTHIRLAVERSRPQLVPNTAVNNDQFTNSKIYRMLYSCTHMAIVDVKGLRRFISNNGNNSIDHLMTPIQ